MKCPVCKTTLNHVELDIHVNGLDENISECEVCGTSWSINHGTLEVIRDSQAKSFLEAASECVESDDYNVAMV
ncbi:MAG: hypothetical protein RQ723_07840 [Desulfuromonadales bacterium]|nr:hypothetical protein [Desulfuromonadales bacterium]